ncbi:hypothetical protein K1T71_006662 [Dendrolimus kikuchii]|uniref:Uncharacterized protein n=1 Tax=Dendrolimus kikuchii TaxID=765133 RepID=A0ACC1D235_9NEOP|nr:hypothetical protein K1T71_006662 [Dendrolimus kikuchii]
MDKISKTVSSEEEIIAANKVAVFRRKRGRGRGQTSRHNSLEDFKSTFIATELSEEDLVEREFEVIEVSEKATKRRALRLALRPQKSQTAVALQQHVCPARNIATNKFKMSPDLDEYGGAHTFVATARIFRAAYTLSTYASYFSLDAAGSVHSVQYTFIYSFTGR